MPSYFRNLFGGSSHNTSSKSHSRSQSQPPIYASAGNAAGVASNAPQPTGYGYSTTRSTGPSPLRFATDSDTRAAYGYGKHTPSHSPRASTDSRPPVRRGSSYKAPESAGHYPIYTPGSHLTPTSSRSNSNSSLFTSMGSMPFNSSYSDSGHRARRPSLGSPPTWQSSAGSASSYASGHSQSRSKTTAYVPPRTATLHMHPLLAHTRLHHAPITYDIIFTPSARTVLDRATHSPIPAHTLSQPATDPPTLSSSRLVLRSHKFPWPVIVGPSGPRFTISPSKQGRGSSTNTITNLDVLYAVHTTLLTPVTPEEWESLGHGSRAQQKVTKAYEKRCTRMGGGWEGGVKRVDWLGEKTRLIGVEVDKSAGGGGVGKLVFAKA